MKKIKKVLFVGSKELGLKCLKCIYKLDRNALIGAVTIHDRTDSRSVYRNFVNFCKREKLKLYTVKNKKAFNKIIIEVKPDLCMVVGWYWLIDREILEILPHGSIGIHGSLLPKYRGASPLVWAIINGEKETGVSMFSFEEGMDNGNIWGQIKIKIGKDDYIADLLSKVEKASLHLLQTKYKKILSSAVVPKKQDFIQATYCAQRIAEDGRIIWSKSADEIYRFIRAQAFPYPGAFSFWERKKLIIWRAKKSNLKFYGTAGQVAKVGSEGVYVICGDQKPIVLEEVQMENGKKLSAFEVIKSIKIRLK